MNPFKKLLPALSLAGFLALAGCSSSPTSTPAEDATANIVQSEESDAQSAPQSEEPVGPSEADLQAYFGALATDNPPEIAEAASLAAPGSIAYAYATYLAAAQQASRDAGLQANPGTSSPIENGFEMCPVTVTEDNPCVEYTNIQHDGDKVADFDVNGQSLHGRLSLGSGEVKPLGELASMELIASYKTASGHVVGVFEVRSQSDGLSMWATYVAPDGRQQDMVAVNGPSMLSNGALANYMFWFEGAEFGGTIKVEGLSDDSYETSSVEFATQ